MRKLLKKIRLKNKLTQREMGIRLKLGSGDEGGQSFVSQMESGSRLIPLRVVYILPRLFKVSDKDLKQINDYLERIV
jgi:transcriptional regulator with XRE-family HTH domain